MIREAIELHLEGLRDKGLPIPRPSTDAGMVEIPTDWIT
jgi:predicted RNase H-like HicB family nuclease